MDVEDQEKYKNFLKYSRGTKNTVERELTRYKEIKFENVSQERILLCIRMLIKSLIDIHVNESILQIGRVDYTGFDYMGLEKEIREKYNIPDSIPSILPKVHPK